MIRIHVFRCGATVVDEALPLANKSKNPFAYEALQEGKSTKLKFLLRHI